MSDRIFTPKDVGQSVDDLDAIVGLTGLISTPLAAHTALRVEPVAPACDTSLVRKKTTLAQVALRAGVSKTTASYVLNRSREMSAETTARVLHAAKELGYRLDTRASGLRKGGTHVVGVVTVGSATDMVLIHNGLFWPRFTDAFVYHCSSQHVVVSFAGEDKAQALIDSGIDVLVVLGIHSSETFDEVVLPYGLPTVSVAPIKGHDVTLLSHDADKIADQVVSHVAGQGGKVLAWMHLDLMAKVLDRWPAALERAGKKHGVATISRALAGDQDAWTAAMAEVIDAGTDAVFSLSASTRMVLDAIEAAGKSVPDDVLLVAQAEGVVEEAMHPSVSYLSLEAASSAEQAAGIVVDVIAGKDLGSGAGNFPFTLNVRDSSSRS